MISKTGRKLMCFLCVLAMTFALVPGRTVRVSAAMTGAGTAESPYAITCAADLIEFARIVNEGNTGAYARLTTDIDMSGVISEENPWTPIGSDSEKKYAGTFDGQNKSVQGLIVSGDNSGLFGYVSASGTVKNVKISGGSASGSYSGGVVGNNEGTISGCESIQNVTGEVRIGGISGNNQGTISDCVNKGSISGSGTSSSYVGGIAGFNQGAIIGCTNAGSISGAGEVYYAGGITGYVDFCASATLRNCVNNARVEGKNYVGGISGLSELLVEGCINSGDVSGDTSVGGIVGAADVGSSIEGCSNSGDVSGDTSVGGIIGSPQSYSMTISDTTESGKVEGRNYVGLISGAFSNGVSGGAFNLQIYSSPIVTEKISIIKEAGASTVKLTATPASGYSFFGWKIDRTLDDIASTDNPYILTLENDTFFNVECLPTASPATVTANNRTYDGTQKPLVIVSGGAIGGEMRYALGTANRANDAYSSSIPEATAAGTYYVWYKVSADESHGDFFASRPIVVMISRESSGGGVTIPPFVQPVPSPEPAEEDPEPEPAEEPASDPAPEPGPAVKSKEKTVGATVEYKGEKITVNANMTWDGEVTYTGGKIKPSDVGYKLDLSDLYDEVKVEKGDQKPEDLFEIRYVNKNNVHKSASGKKASFYAKIKLNEQAAKEAGLSEEDIEGLKAVVDALNEKLKNNPCRYKVNPVKLSKKDTKVTATVKWKGEKISKVKSIRVTVPVNGEEKTFRLKPGQYKIKVKNAAKHIVMITGKGDFKGTITVKLP